MTEFHDQYSDSEDTDIDRTDELPPLSEEAIRAAGGEVPIFADELADEDTGRHPMLFDAPVAPAPRRNIEFTHDGAAIAVLEEALREARREVDEARSSRGSLSEVLEQREAQLTALTRERLELQNRLAEAEAAISRLRAGNERLEVRLAEQGRIAGRQDEHIAALQKELSERLAALRVLQAGARPANGGGSPDERAQPLPEPILLCLTSDTPERHVIDPGEILIGRGPDCTIRIPTHFVSRHHARVTSDDGIITIEDCGSTNGVFVNSIRVDRQTLEHGDWVTIGETQFRFLDEGAPR
jgi:FHA domain